MCCSWMVDAYVCTSVVFTPAHSWPLPCEAWVTLSLLVAIPARRQWATALP